MLGKAMTLFEIFGFKIKVDISWAFLAVLIAWSLSQGFFPEYYAGLPQPVYWWMGLVGMVGLFVSIVLHELAHSIVARGYGMEIRGITLWLLGGVAELADEPPTPMAEFTMAIAGPVISLLLAGFFHSLSLALQASGLEPAIAVLQYLALLNIIVTIFNLVPAFPMDGGRVLRSILWAVKKDFHWATRVAARTGSFFGLALIVIGVLEILVSSDFRGLWWIILGMFVRFSADASLQRVSERVALANVKVADVMTDQPVSVPANIDIQRFVDDWLFRHHHDIFPVVRDGQLVGTVSVKAVKRLPREDWSATTVEALMEPLSGRTSIDAQAGVEAALEKMRSGDVTRLVVTRAGVLSGMLALKDVLKFIAHKKDLVPAS